MAESSRLSALQVGTTALLTLAAGTVGYFAGNFEVVENIIVQGLVVQTGGILPITGDFTLSNVGSASSGALSIQNPYDRDVYCDQFVLDITTAASPDTFVSIGTATGAVSAVTGVLYKGSGTNIAERFFLKTGVHTLTGSSLIVSNTPQTFKLNKKGGTTDYINVKSSGTQSGQLLVGTYRINCFRTN